MKKLRHSVLLASAALLVSQASYAGDMQNDLSILLSSHPRLNAETENVAAAKAATNTARAGYLPRLDTTAAYGYEDTDRTELTPAGDSFDLESTSAAITATQNLFEGFRTDASVNSASSLAAQAEATMQTTKQQLLFEGSSAYIAVLRQIRLTELSKRNMATLTTQLELEDERVERGSGVAVDVLQAKSRLQISKERYTAFVGGLEESRARFMQLFGFTPEVEEMTLPALPAESIPETLELAIEIALANNPTLKVTQWSITSLEHQKDVAKAGFYPSVDVVASSNYDDNVSGIRGTDISNSVILRGSWNLFSGFADKSRHKQAIAQHQSAIATGHDTQRRVVEEVKLAWANLTTSKKRAELLENAVNIATEVYDARTRLRDAGKDTALNVLDAENEVFRAQIDATAAQHDYHTATYRLLQATGTLQLNKIID